MLDLMELTTVTPLQTEALSSSLANPSGEKASMRYCSAVSVGRFVYVLGYLVRNGGTSIRNFLAVLDTRQNQWRWVRLGDSPSGGHGMFLLNDSMQWVTSPKASEERPWALLHFDMLLEEISVGDTYGAVPSARYGSAGHYVESNNHFLLFGGRTRGMFPQNLNDVHLLNLGNKVWVKSVVTGERPPPGYRHGTCFHRGALYVFGGRINGGHLGDGMYILRFAKRGYKGTWSKPRVTGGEASPRSSLSLVSYQGVVILCGGLPERGVRIQVYDPQSGAFNKVVNRGADRSIGFGGATVLIEGGRDIAVFGDHNQISNYVRLSAV